MTYLTTCRKTAESRSPVYSLKITTYYFNSVINLFYVLKRREVPIWAPAPAKRADLLPRLSSAQLHACGSLAQSCCSHLECRRAHPHSWGSLGEPSQRIAWGILALKEWVQGPHDSLRNVYTWYSKHRSWRCLFSQRPFLQRLGRLKSILEGLWVLSPDILLSKLLIGSAWSLS